MSVVPRTYCQTRPHAVRSRNKVHTQAREALSISAAPWQSASSLSSALLCHNRGCCCCRASDNGGSSLSPWPASPLTGAQLASHKRQNIRERRYWLSGVSGGWPAAALARNHGRGGGTWAAAAPVPCTTNASCLSWNQPTAPLCSPTIVRRQRRSSIPAHPAAALLARRRRGSATATASAPTNASGATAASTGKSIQPGDVDELLYTPGGDVPYYMGPLELREVPGAGVGVFVTGDVPCGTLLLACYPLALLRGDRPMDDNEPASADAAPLPPPPPPPPSPLELAHALGGAVMSPLAAAWMLGLYDGIDDDDDGAASGGGGDEGGRSRTRRRLNQLRQLFRQPFDASAAAPADDDPSATSTSGSTSGGVRCPLPDDVVAQLVTFNAYGEARPDPVVAAVRHLSGEQLSGCVGLWPPFSLINHSCAPVASYGMVGDVMVVRAATDLNAGQQVTISYFGRRALGPLELRRAYLAQHYGFICTCERCTLESSGTEGDGEGEEAGGTEGLGKGQAAAAAAAAVRVPSELPAFLENLHVSCSRAAAPHLYDMLTGRRWTAAAAAPAAVSSNEPVSELEDELQELYGYLSECWQQLLRAAAVAAGPTAAVTGFHWGEREDEEDDGGGGGGGLSQQEVLWLEGSVFVLLDQLLVVVGLLGLLGRVQEQVRTDRRSAAAAAVKAATTAGGSSGGRRATATAAKGTLRKSAATAAAAADGAADVVSHDGGGGDAADVAAATAVELPLTAATAMRAVASRLWRVEELPRSFLLPYVDLLAQAQEVAAAVVPGSDLAVACAVRLLYGVQAVLGSDSDDFRQAEISCYDALSARYGVLEYDTYEQILEVCSQLRPVAAQPSQRPKRRAHTVLVPLPRD